MNEMAGWGKIAADGGMAAVMTLALVLFYRLADKYGAAFLHAQEGLAAAMTAQAGAMAGLATAVKEGQSDQRDVLIAVRLLGQQIDRQEKYLEQIEQRMDDNCQKRCLKGVA